MFRSVRTGSEDGVLREGTSSRDGRGAIETEEIGDKEHKERVRERGVVS